MPVLAKGLCIALLGSIVAACGASPPAAPAAEVQSTTVVQAPAPSATVPAAPAATEAPTAGATQIPTTAATIAATAAPVATSAPAAADFPLTIDNCGVQQTFAAPPKRAIALYLNTSEILAAIGATDHVIGMVGDASKALPAYTTALGGVKAVSKSEYPLPSREVFIAEKPDFMLTGAGGDFAADALGTRDDLQKLGIATYQMTATCENGDRSLAALQADIVNLGRIFGVADKAEAFVADQNTRIAAVKTKLAGVKPVTVAHIDGIDTTPYIGHGQLLNELLADAGAKNIFAELAPKGNSSQVSWEELVARNPEILLVSDYDSPPVSELIGTIESNPALATVSAVTNKQLFPILLADITTGARSADAVETLAKRFHPEVFK